MQTLHLANCYIKTDENNEPKTLHVLPSGGDWLVTDISAPDANVDVLRPLIDQARAKAAA